jgi:hypothetical protein
MAAIELQRHKNPALSTSHCTLLHAENGNFR